MVSPSPETKGTMVMGENLAASMNAKLVGSGKETVVLAHGYGGDQSAWDRIVPLLAARHRLLLFDWCFSGAVKDPSLYHPNNYSSYDAFADDLICVMEEMKVSGCVFVGHSMSGMIGCIASLKRPDLFTRLVLVGASPRYLNLIEEGYNGGFDLSDVEEMLSNIDSKYEQWAPAFASVVVDASDPLSVEKFANSLKRMNPQTALSLAKTVFLADYRYVLEKVVVPCNIIHTRNDVVVPLAAVEYMQNTIKAKAEVDIIDTEGHFPHLTAHLQFVQVLDRILGC
ncbi:probable strigolactone esterase DAD2 [Salvia miltiorrhiza]|uniref:probable strigolactone esterase DAD2 n=1 Tax=Salvia miltiorrhiza TaxID=226208 RepID=UPI0025ACC4BC|nr:probable strigolactone esterase DAD2 [Salvia miltiorrhiza]